MAGYYLHAFDWDAVEQELAKPNVDLVNHLLDKITEKQMKRLNSKGLKPEECIVMSLSSEDWATGRSAEEMFELEGLLHRVIDYWLSKKTISKKLSLKSLGNESLPDVVVMSATEFLNEESDEPDGLCSLLNSFGTKPFRFPNWEDYSQSHQEFNPFDPGCTAASAYMPEYAIYRTAEVISFLEVFEKAAPLFEISKAEKAKRTKAVQEKKEMKQAYEEELINPLRELVKHNLALYVTWDC